MGKGAGRYKKVGGGAEVLPLKGDDVVAMLKARGGGHKDFG